jgi:hypothetical protein
VRLEVVVPARTGRGSAVRRDHDVSPAIAQVGSGLTRLLPDFAPV